MFMFCTKMLLVVTALCASLVSAAPRERDEGAVVDGPSFCGGRECAPFETIKSEAEYEVRRYPGAKWVSTDYSVGSNSPGRQSSQAFMRLFTYIVGKNSEGAKIPMTVPVVTKTTPDNSFIRSFYMPAAFQENTPQPLEEGVYIDDKPDLIVFVRSYTGWKNSTAQQETLAALQAAVGDMAVPGVHFKAGYGPYKSPEAHNEIWMEAIEDVE